MSQSDTFTCLIVRDETQFRALELDWNNLWKSSPAAAFFQSFSFCVHTWEEIAKPANRSLFCITIREKGRLVLVWPLVIFRNGPFKIARSLGPWAAEATDILVDPDSDVKTITGLAWDTVVKRSGCDVLSLLFVRASSALNDVIPGSVVGTRDLSPYADISDQLDWEEYSKLIGLNARHDLNRKRRRLSETGTIDYVAVDTREEPKVTAELIAWMMTNKQEWANKSGKNGSWLFSPEYQSFLIKQVTDRRNIEKYMLYAMLIDKEPVAVILIAFGPVDVDLVIAGFHADPKYSRYSPGFILDGYWMEKVFKQRLNVNFGVGNERHKLFWARGNTRDLISYKIPLSVKGKIGLALREKAGNIYHYIQKLLGKSQN